MQRVWLKKELYCAHPLVFNNGTPIGWTSSIMGAYDIEKLEPCHMKRRLQKQ